MASNGSQTLTTNIKLNAVASGFTDVGSTIGQMGEMIDTLSRKVINFGKESLVVYQDYEKSMTQAEIALSTRYGRGTQELSNVMTSLNEAAADWAKSTIFHTDDVANAILQAARSGWSFEEIMSGIPTVMQLAEAGGIDLSTALDYVVKSMAAYGVETDEMQDFVDMWVFAANSSTGSVETFGDAMLRMGSTMRFTDGKEELFTLIAIMHDMGESGSTAATMLRNAMLRILVPGSKAAGESLDSLMVTGEELEELYSDADLFASMQALEEHGFSAYDEAGKAKPMLQIYSELGDALAKMAGGWDEIAKNEQTLTILKSVFGQRAITGAMDIVMGLGEAYTLQQRLLNGEAEGYGEWSADKMLETLYGRTEIYESKKEELHRRTGEALAGQWESVLETMGGVLDTFNTLDDVKFNAIVKGLESIALLSTGMIATSTALKFIGTVLTPTGALALGLAGLVSAWTVFKELQESDYKMQFGTGELDTATLTTYVQQIGTAFSTAYTQVDSFRAGVDAAQESYKTASSTFASKLFSDMITHASLTDDERTALMNLGNDMYAALQEGITQSTAATLGYWQQLFGGEEVAEDNPAYQEIFALTNTAYENAVAEAKMLSQGLRDALTSAFADGEITQDEYSDLLTYMRNYNDAMARATVEAQREEDFVRMSTWMHKAQVGVNGQTFGFEGVNESNPSEHRFHGGMQFPSRIAGNSGDEILASGIPTEIAQHLGGDFHPLFPGPSPVVLFLDFQKCLSAVHIHARADFLPHKFPVQVHPVHFKRFGVKIDGIVRITFPGGCLQHTVATERSLAEQLHQDIFMGHIFGVNPVHQSDGIHFRQRDGRQGPHHRMN